jgi:HPt (histidine-containing phosphotransfer) domain-containing protein
LRAAGWGTILSGAMERDLSWIGEPAELEWALPEGLRQLVILGDEETVAEIIEVFRSDTAARLELLRESVELQHREEARAQAHAIKGSAIQVGANGMAMVCRQIEALACAGPEAEIAGLTKRLDIEFQAFSRMLEGKLRAAGAPDSHTRHKENPGNSR